MIFTRVQREGTEKSKGNDRDSDSASQNDDGGEGDDGGVGVRGLDFLQMRSALLLAFLLVAFPGFAQWEIQTAPTTADLRGIDSVGGGVAWASGSEGPVLRTTDDGAHWQRCDTPPGAVLDRIDALLLAAPVLWCVLLLKDAFSLGRF